MAPIPVRLKSAHLAKAVSLLGVEYWPMQTVDGGDLYLTRFGAPVWNHLLPHNWYEPDWFRAMRERLPGTSAIFKVPTKELHGVSINLVVRFSRVGQEVPVDAATLCQFPDAEFNSPFEEFGLVMELREVGRSPSHPFVLTKKPLAIYVPAQEIPLWQSGRVEEKIAAKLARDPAAAVDIARAYLLLYGWIDGLNAVQTSEALGLTGSPRENFLKETTLRAVRHLEELGFRVLDMKPEHIVFPHPFDPALAREGKAPYALVDYELLERH